MAGSSQSAAAVGEQERLSALAGYGVLDTPAEADFDDLAHLAAELCAAPVALVSFVDADRQWFKARVGFTLPQTDLSSSVCRFVLAEPDVLVIPDLTADARTCESPLVTGEPHIRFYAGAPLRTSEGHVLGSLCVIDTVARPQGLTERQANNLRRLAEQVVSQLELRRLVRLRDDAYGDLRIAGEALTTKEAYWRGLFEKLQEGFVVAEAVRDAAGRISDWRYLQVNAAWSEMVGLEGSEVIGRTIREVLPGVEQSWVDLARVVDTGETASFTQRVEQLDRWYEGRASAIGPNRFCVLFLEVTERVRSVEALAASAARKAALAELGDHLRSARTPDAISYVAAEIMGRVLSAARAGYGAVNAHSETINVPPDWRAPGVTSVAGEHSFRSFGSYIDDLKRGETVIVPDVCDDPRTSGSGAAALASIGVRGLVNSPVLEHGELVSISFVHFDQPRQISGEEQAFIRAVADRTQLGIARLRSEERQAILNGEISHRLANVLAMVQGLASQTLRKEVSQETMAAFSDRLAALSRAQDALMKADWQTTDLKTLICSAVEMAGVEDRCSLSGPPAKLGPRATLSTSLLLHELSTNARKYGALSRAEGRIVISWLIDADDVLTLAWGEEGGPEATPPSHTGFGSRLLRAGLVGTGGCELAYEPHGFSARFRAPLKQLAEA